MMVGSNRELVAPGDEIVVAGNVGIAIGLSSGTSLASPMLAGALASLSERVSRKDCLGNP